MFEPEVFRKQMYCIEESICYQDCGVGGKISDSDFLKFPTLSFQNFLLRPFQNFRLATP